MAYERTSVPLPETTPRPIKPEEMVSPIWEQATAVFNDMEILQGCIDRGEGNHVELQEQLQSKLGEMVGLLESCTVRLAHIDAAIKMSDDVCRGWGGLDVCTVDSRQVGRLSRAQRLGDVATPAAPLIAEYLKLEGSTGRQRTSSHHRADYEVTWRVLVDSESGAGSSVRHDSPQRSCRLAIEHLSFTAKNGEHTKLRTTTLPSLRADASQTALLANPFQAAREVYSLLTYLNSPFQIVNADGDSAA